MPRWQNCMTSAMLVAMTALCDGPRVADADRHGRQLRGDAAGLEADDEVRSVRLLGEHGGGTRHAGADGDGPAVLQDAGGTADHQLDGGVGHRCHGRPPSHRPVNITFPDPEQHLQLVHRHLGRIHPEVVAQPELGPPPLVVLHLHVHHARPLLPLQDRPDPVHRLRAVLAERQVQDHPLGQFRPGLRPASSAGAGRSSSRRSAGRPRRRPRTGRCGRRRTRPCTVASRSAT